MPINLKKSSQQKPTLKFQMIQLANKNSKTAIKNIFKNLKDDMQLMNEQKWHFSTETVTIKNSQMKILNLK